jgi:hypothetical protein
VNQAGQHTPNLLQLAREPGVRGRGQELEIPRKKEIILKFIAGTQGMEQKSPKVWI